MTETKTAGTERRLRWGFCPVCYRERKFTPEFKMLYHRRWVAIGLYGYMESCPGTDQQALPPYNK